ncbi:MAG: hypothetical protein OXF06_05815 [Bacteroidetes bacterium]|nr:hypothetical protein [Bacteroidota bacterium]
MIGLSPFLAMVLCLGMFAMLMGGLKLLEKKAHVHQEILRKGVHVGSGILALPLPWIFDEVWPVIIIGTLITSTLIAARTVPSLRRTVGTVMGGVQRNTIGEIYFVISVVILFLISQGQWLLYVIPLLTMSLADTAAAMVGIRYGQTQYQTSEGVKSVEGSLAFFLVTFFSTHLVLLLFTDTGRAESLLISTILALLVMMLELLSWRGLDNIFVPFSTHAFLRLYLESDAQLILFHLTVAIVLVIFTLAWRRRSKLDDSALIGCALFGYVAFTLGGWQWLIAPLGFFALYVVLWPRSSERRSHTIYTLLTMIGAPLFCLFTYAMTDIHWLLIPFAISFASHLTLNGISRVTLQSEMNNRFVQILGTIGSGWIFVYAPTVVLMFNQDVGLGDLTALKPEAMELMADLGIGLLAIGIVALIFLPLTKRIYGPPLRANLINPTFACLGLFASLIVIIKWII